MTGFNKGDYVSKNYIINEPVKTVDELYKLMLSRKCVVILAHSMMMSCSAGPHKKHMTPAAYLITKLKIISLFRLVDQERIYSITKIVPVEVVKKFLDSQKNNGST